MAKYEDIWWDGYSDALSDIMDCINEKAKDDRLRAFIVYIVHEALEHREIEADKYFDKLIDEIIESGEEI